MRRRLQFWRSATMKGALHFGLIGGLITFAVGGSLFAVLHWVFHLSAAWAVAIVLVGVLAVFAEGAYRVWDEADQARLTAEGQLSTQTPGIQAWDNLQIGSGTFLHVEYGDVVPPPTDEPEEES